MELPPTMHEIMLVNLPAYGGVVRCQVLKFEVGENQGCVRISVPPKADLKAGETRVKLKHIDAKKLHRSVSVKMPLAWSTWLAELLGLDGGSAEVRESGCDCQKTSLGLAWRASGKAVLTLTVGEHLHQGVAGRCCASSLVRLLPLLLSAVVHQHAPPPPSTAPHASPSLHTHHCYCLATSR